MKNVVLLRYSEIHLKGKNRKFFEKVLFDNISFALNGFQYNFSKFSGRYIISDYSENDQNAIVENLLNVAGLHSVSVAIETQSTYQCIEEAAEHLACGFIGSFKVSVNRADKSFSINSMQLAKMLGANILDINPSLNVDLFNPKHTLYVDIRENGFSYVFSTISFAIGGMPVGTSGNGLLLLSGGIDSPVAGYRMIKRGMKLDCLHFESFPFTSKAAEDKAIDLAKILQRYNGKTRIFIVSLAEIQQSIHKHCKNEYMITLVRRFMLRIANILAKKYSLQAIVTGESLGQVASQTVESMTVIGSVSDLPLFRPLIAYDKQETIDIANKICSYDISIRPYDDCCTVYLPDSPVIKPKLNTVLIEESKLDINLLINNALSTLRIRFADDEI